MQPGPVREIGDVLRSQYGAAQPWPHLVLDDTISSDLAAAATGEVTALPESAFTWERTRRIRKGSISDVVSMGPCLRQLISEFSSDDFLAELRSLTGIDDLAGDPSLTYAGVYLTPPGGWQRIHEDFAQHPVTHLWNRAAVLLYLSPWMPGDGGELELWGDSGTDNSALIAPVPGRMVVFEPSARTLHGIRIVSPSSGCRIALGMRYYSATAPPVRPRPLRQKLIRRPGEQLLDVVPSAREVAKTIGAHINARLSDTRLSRHG